MRATALVWAAAALASAAGAACGKKDDGGGGAGKPSAADVAKAKAEVGEYQAKSKTTEAKMQVKKMFDGARVYAAEHAKLPVGDTGLVPATPCCKQAGGKCAPDAAAWSGELWTALNFSVDDPHYYRYQFVSDGKSFTARALGDLDCDDAASTFEMQGTLSDTGELSGGGGMFQKDELE